jgi:hypothetical protein
MNILSLKLGMAALLCLTILIVIWSVLRRSKLIESRIDLDDLLLGDDGKLSKAAAVLLGSFILTSWIMIYLTLTGKMTEGYFTSFSGIWIIPTVTKLIVNRPAPTSVRETVVATSATTTQ